MRRNLLSSSLTQLGTLARLIYCKAVYRASIVDLVFSAGRACRTANALKRVKLRTFSSPLDWMLHYELPLYTELFRKKKFDLFRDYEEDEEWSGEHRSVKDIQTGMVSLHHFDKTRSIQEQFPEFSDAMNRRLEHLSRSIRQSRDVGIVMNRDIPLEEIQEFVESLAWLFPQCAFHVLNMRHSETQSGVKWGKIRRTGIHSLREVYFNDTHPKGGMESGNADGWLGNLRVWKKVLRRSFFLRTHG